MSSSLSEQIVWWHASQDEHLTFSDAHPLHLGTEAQARMRRKGWLHRFTLTPEALRHVQRSRDTGGQWNGKIKAARTHGKRLITYLNRYEGVPVEAIERLAKTGTLDKLDRMDDKTFRKHVPEAQDSLIVLNPQQDLVALGCTR